MISVGILDGAGPTEVRRHGPRYRLIALIVGVFLAVFTGSYISHGLHDQQPFDVQKRNVLDEPLQFNESLLSLPQEFVSPDLVSRAASQELWDRKVLSGRRSVKALHDFILVFPFQSSTLSCQLGRNSADNINAISGLNQMLSSCFVLMTITELWCMMNSDDLQVGTLTLQTLLSTGWEEDDEVEEGIIKAWRKGLGTANGLMNTANEFPRSWDHVNIWTDDQGRIRLVRIRSHATATLYFTDLHDLIHRPAQVPWATLLTARMAT